MADFADIGSDAEQASIADAINRQRAMAAKAEALEATGECHNPRCGDDVPDTKLFCGPKCRDEYEYLKKRGMQ